MSATAQPGPWTRRTWLCAGLGSVLGWAVGAGAVLSFEAGAWPVFGAVVAAWLCAAVLAWRL